MSYSINFPLQVNNSIPPSKRMPAILDLFNSYTRALSWRAGIQFGSYYLGSTDPGYVLVNTYNQGDRVIYLNNVAGASYYGDNAVYEANTAVPANTPPIAANQVDEAGNGYWIKVQSNFIGTLERQSYTSQKTTFEFALNRWFHTTFRQPGGPLSDIYIVTNQVPLGFWFVGPTAPLSFLAPDSANTRAFSGPHPTDFSQPDFTIYVPVAVFNQLSATPGLREGIVRAFADTINCAGMVYNVVTY